MEVQSTQIENVTFPNKASIKTTKLGKENGATGRNGAFPVTTLQFLKFGFSLKTFYKE